jgi:hypothetical protein
VRGVCRACLTAASWWDIAPSIAEYSKARRWVGVSGGSSRARRPVVQQGVRFALKRSKPIMENSTPGRIKSGLSHDTAHAVAHQTLRYGLQQLHAKLYRCIAAHHTGDNVFRHVRALARQSRHAPRSCPAADSATPTQLFGEVMRQLSEQPFLGGEKPRKSSPAAMSRRSLACVCTRSFGPKAEVSDRGSRVSRRAQFQVPAAAGQRKPAALKAARNRPVSVCWPKPNTPS